MGFHNVEMDEYELNILKSLLEKSISNEKERFRQYLLAGDHFGANTIQDTILRMSKLKSKLGKKE